VSKYQPYQKYKECEAVWLGEVPEHWEVWKLPHAFSTIGSGTTSKSGEAKYYDDGNIPRVTTGEPGENIINNTSKKLTQKALIDYPTLKLYQEGSILIVMYGATIGRLGVLGIQATTNQDCCVINHSKVIINLGYGRGQPNISQENIINLRISAPSLSEQQKVMEFLDTKTQKIDILIEKSKQAIILLKERGTALISAAVTGKIDEKEVV
jgi:type I restriction enzyme S subunit